MPDSISNVNNSIRRKPDVSDVAYRRTSNVISDNATMKIEDYYKIMAAQLQYQDPSNPTSSSDMLNQMAQMSLIGTIDSMNKMSQTSYAASMIGKEVIAVKTDRDGHKVTENVKGTVTGVNLSGKEITVWIDGKEFKLSSVMQIGDDSVPAIKPPVTDKPAEDKTEDKKPEVDKAENKPVRAFSNRVQNSDLSGNLVNEPIGMTKEGVPVYNPDEVRDNRLIKPVG